MLRALVPSNLERGATTMSRVDEYRRYAAECLRIAQETCDPEAKARLLNMAQKWRELGEKAEEAAASDVSRNLRRKLA